MKAPTPFHFKCPHCKAKLRIQMRGFWLLCAFIVCLFIGLAVGCVAAWRAFGQKGLFIGLLCYAAAGVLADLLSGIIFYTYGTFTSTPTKEGK
jgi:Ca2+/Na+ antiporter